MAFERWAPETFKQNGGWIWNITTLRKSSFFGIYFRDICIDNSKSWLLFQNRCTKIVWKPKASTSISSGEWGAFELLQEVLPLNTGSFSSIKLGDDFFKEIGPSKKWWWWIRRNFWNFRWYFSNIPQSPFQCHGLGGTLFSHTGG